MKDDDASPDRIAFGSFELDLRQRVLLRGGAPVPLGSRATELLCALARAPGTLVGKDELIARIWPRTIVEENNLQVQVSALRKALAADAGGAQWLQTVSGRGYRFVAPVRNAVTTPSAGAGGASPPEKPAIAVLPFANLSNDPEQQYFADGIAEDMITALSRFSELFVIARNSSFALRDAAGDPQRVAAELGVRYVLDGSVRKAGGQLRITASLVDAHSRRQLWADRFDGALEDLFALQDRVTARVVGALLPTLRQAEIERARRKAPASLDAYDYLLRALPLVIANATGPARDAIPLLEQALRLAPDYAYAHALLAMACAQVFRATADPDRQALRERGIAHARRALEVASDDSVALAYAGFILLMTAQDAGGARTAVDRAVQLNPNSATTLSYRALVLAMIGDPHAAIADADAALRLSPLDPANYQPQMAIVIARVGLGEHDEAVHWARRTVESAPPGYPMSHAWLAVAECGRGNVEGARQAVRRLQDLLPGGAPARVERLFDVFPQPLRTEAVARLRGAGLLAA